MIDHAAPILMSAGLAIAFVTVVAVIVLGFVRSDRVDDVYHGDGEGAA